MELEDRSPQFEPLALNENFAEAKTKEALRVLILQRFAGWLDDVLAEEKPLEGVAAELLAELHDRKDSDTAGPGDGAYDLHSTWSAMTALTQEIKLQGRTFKQLSEKIAPFAELDESIDKLVATHREALSDARRIAEEGRADRTQRESELKLEAWDRARRELIGVIIEIRDSLIIGLRSAAESQGKLEEHREWSRLKKIFKKKAADQNYKLEIVNSLKKGYRMGLDRIDEALQRLGVNEIVCEGRPFDPRIMNAVDIEETGEVPDGTVLEVYRTGYLIDSEVLQPAQVKVARAPEQTTRD
ncbi:MAG: nucleotide exchange factor GrpE [Deltaproteobacteria bacterium]|nr:nucleotide exchange factor GrpE [Deltaproteobacteria bacterium]